MINSFSSRYLILGDFNGHSHLWGANQENERGKIVEKLIDRHNLILLNDSVHTRFDTYHQTSSLLDLSLCHPSIYMDVACKISSDRLGSDHHPIIITANTSDHPVPERVSKWNFKKAKWDAFQDQCITEITPDLFNSAEDKMAIFSSTFLDIAADNIPKTSLVTPYGDMDVGQHWLRLWLVAYRHQAITETIVDNHGILHRCGSKDNHQLHLQKSIL